jgi:hypothetical protein
VLQLSTRTGQTMLELAVAHKRVDACASLSDAADLAEAAKLPTFPVRRGIAGGRFAAMRRAAKAIAQFKPVVGQKLRAKKRPIGHRKYEANRYYPAVVTGINGDGSLRVHYPDEGRRGIVDEMLTVSAPFFWHWCGHF